LLVYFTRYVAVFQQFCLMVIPYIYLWLLQHAVRSNQCSTCMCATAALSKHSLGGRAACSRLVMIRHWPQGAQALLVSLVQQLLIS
jgi:hypothetical protein